MEIVSIEKYKGATYCVEFDEGENVYLNSTIIADFGLKSGLEISDEELLKVVHASDFRRAKERALYLLDFRDHSYKELFDKLEKNYDDEICFEVLAKLVEIGLINDEEYAKKFAKKLVEGKHFGSWRAKQELRMKGIDDETIEEVLEPYEDDTAERLAELVEKKYARYIVDRKGLKRVQGALARQGYGYADIRTALEDYAAEIED